MRSELLILIVVRKHATGHLAAMHVWEDSIGETETSWYPQTLHLIVYYNSVDHLLRSPKLPPSSQSFAPVEV